MLRDIRNNYQKYSLDEKLLNSNPLNLFEQWLDEALAQKIIEPTVMILSTIIGNMPDSRVVLLKELTDKGLIFYTNYLSKKGEQIEKNSNVALIFFWAELERQVRIKGVAKKIGKKKSEDYFNSRPRDSQLGAFASRQSRQIENRKELVRQFRFCEEQFEGKEIPMPDAWGGYLVEPFEMEFWQGRPGRMHDRILYSKQKKKWLIMRLQP